MPDPIPRNRSAGRSRPRRLTRRPRDWPGRPFRQRRENAEQPAPPPAPPPARPPAARRRPAHRQRGWPRGPLQQRQGNVQRPGPRPPRPRPTRSSSQVVVGVLLCAVAALVVGIVVPPLFPSDTSSGSVVAAPASGQAGVVAPGSGDPNQADSEPAAPPAAPGADRVQTQPAPALVGNRTAVPPGGGSSAPAGQSDPVTEPSPPVDLGQRADRSADEPQRLANTESGNSRPRTDPDPKPPPPPPPPSGGATRADYEKAMQAAISKYQPGSPRPKPDGGKGGEGNGGGGGDDGGADDGADDGGGDGGGTGGGDGGASEDIGD